MFLSRLVIHITKVSFLNMMCILTVYLMQTNVLEWARTNTQTGGNQHIQVSTNEQHKCKWVQTCRHADKEALRTQVSTCTKPSGYKPTAGQARTSQNKQVAGTSMKKHGWAHAQRAGICTKPSGYKPTAGQAWMGLDKPVVETSTNEHRWAHAQRAGVHAKPSRYKPTAGQVQTSR